MVAAMMQRLTRRVLHHKRLVAASWILLTLVGIGAAGPASKALDQRFSVPGREGWEASQQIEREFGNGGETLPLMPVVALPPGKTVTSPGVRDELRQIEQTAGAAVPRSRVAGFGSTGDRTFTSRDGRTAFVYVFAPRSDDPFGNNTEVERKLRDALRGKTVGGAPVRLTGYDALADSTGAGDDGPGVLLEALIGGVGALVVLLFVFGSALAFVPLLMAISSILISFLLLWGLTAITEVSPIVQFLVALDRPRRGDRLLAAHRHPLARGARARPRGRRGGHRGDGHGGPRGRVLSGTTVAIGLLALVVLPLPFLRSMGYGGLLIPLVASPWRSRCCRSSSRPSGRGWTAAAAQRRQREPRSGRAGRSVSGAPPLARGRRRPPSSWRCSCAATNLQLGTPTPTRSPSGRRQAGPRRARALGDRRGRAAPLEMLVADGGAPAVARALRGVDGVHGAVAPPAADVAARRHVDRRCRSRTRTARREAGRDVARPRARRGARARHRTSASAAAGRRTPTSSTPSTATSR